MKRLLFGAWLGCNNNDNFNLSTYNYLNDNNAARGIALIKSNEDDHLKKATYTYILLFRYLYMKTLRNIYDKLCSIENLESAFKKARKHKTLKPYVIEFERNLKENLNLLRNELLFQSYKPKPLETFILRDPKTRKISKSDFRDRIVHHAICNVIELFFDKRFIHDSFANRKGKGTLNAVKRFDYFKKKVSCNNIKNCFVLKADVKHYFETVNHKILLNMLSEKVLDERVISLIKLILANHKTKEKGKGMPLGNLTSQFFANVYLNELDQFIKQKLKAEYYIRYVDDFVILHSSKALLEDYKRRIDSFLRRSLDLELHPDKSKIIKLEKGIGFLGFRVFYYHKLLRKKNMKRFERNLTNMKLMYRKNKLSREKVVDCFEGWLAYATHANTFKYRKHMTRRFNKWFEQRTNNKMLNVKKHENFIRKTETSQTEFSMQKTIMLFKKGLNIKRIAKKRRLKESTIWYHLAKAIKNHQISIFSIITKEKYCVIRPNIKNEFNKLKDIKSRIKDEKISYDEINCVLASIRANNRKKNICFLLKRYKNIHCKRKCYNNNLQRKKCKQKFKQIIQTNPNLNMKWNEFIHLFNNHLNICVLPENKKRIFVSWEEFTRKKKYS